MKLWRPILRRTAMRKAAIICLLTLAIVGCSSHGSSTVPAPNSVTPQVVQTGSVGGWVSFPLPSPLGIGLMVDGSDGNVWTTGGNLLRIGMDGTAQEFSDPVGTIVGQDLPYGATLI